jgi:U3 small nucleolar RNA-associated protein 19
MLAAFIKRLSLLALSGPPGAAITILPFIYNIMKRHPGLMVMIHRDSLPPSVQEQDPTTNTTEATNGNTKTAKSKTASEEDPFSSKVLDETSLWELQSLQSHYHPAVSTLTKVFSEAFTKEEFKMEDFLDGGYWTVSGLSCGYCRSFPFHSREL